MSRTTRWLLGLHFVLVTAIVGVIAYGNEFYTHGNFPSPSSPATSASMRAELDLISAGFEKLPILAGNPNKAVVVNAGGTGLTVTTGSLSLGGNLAITGAFNTTLAQQSSTTLTLPPVSGTLATLAGTETFTNKTLTAPSISAPAFSGTATGGLTGLGLTNPSIAGPAFSGTATGSLTNLNLITPIFSTITNSGTLTLPAATDTLVGRATTDTLTNKTLTAPSISAPAFSGTATGSLTGLALVSPTGIVAADIGNVTAFARTFLDDADAATVRTTIGVDVARTLMTAQASTSGTSIDFTGIPTGVKRITVMLSGVSTNGTSDYIVQIGSSSGGIETTGYLGTGSDIGTASAASATSTAGLLAGYGVAASIVCHGQITLVLLDSSTNTWAMTSTIGRSDAGTLYLAASSKSISATLDRVRITTAGGANTFDAGKINVLYE